MPSVKEPTIQFVAKPDFITVVIDGRPFNVHQSHPTFKDLCVALTMKNFAEVPNLVSIGSKIVKSSNGNIQVSGGKLYYKGRVVDSSIAKRIVKGISEGEKVDHFMLFMDRVYANPAPWAPEELYDWLNGSDMPITDDGRFLAYKAVRSDYRDVHSGKYDNHPGQKPEMDRKLVDPDRRNECSDGFHFCSLRYLRSFSGDKIVIVAVDPADVVSIPKDYNFSKGRTWTYEVLKDYGSKAELAPQKDEKEPDESVPYSNKSIEAVGNERQEMLSKILAHPTMQRQIKRGKIQKTTIMKQTYARLKAMYEKLPNLLLPGQTIGNPLKAERKAAGLTLAALAEELGVSSSAVHSAESSLNPRAETINNVRLAIAEIQSRKK